MARKKTTANPKTKQSDFAPSTDAAKEARGNAFLDSIALKPEDIDLSGFKQLSLPPIVKPRQMVGRTIVGEIIELMPSPNRDMKNKLLKLQTGEQIFCFPITASVDNALKMFCGGEIDEEKLIGKTIMLKGLGKTALAGGKTVNVFEVYIKSDEKEKK